MKRYLFSLVIFIFILSYLSGSNVSFIGDKKDNIVKISAKSSWVDTGIDLNQGDYISIQSWGKIKVSKISLSKIFTGRTYDYKVSPKGTYNFESSDYNCELINRRHNEDIKFPLPAGHLGPYPCYALIGKIGKDGDPFLVGDKYVAEIKKSGRLYLGINDYFFKDNSGEFQARITLSQTPFEDNPHIDKRNIFSYPSDFYENIPEKIVSHNEKNVLLIFVDGLIPEVLQEMALNGYLPNIKEHFFDDGVEIKNTFTIYSSDTIPSTASMLTGLFSDKTGIKSQALFRRGFNRPSKTKSLDLEDKFAPEKVSQFLKDNNALALFDFFESEYIATAAPINPKNPPDDWAHIAANYVENPFDAGVRVRENIDYINFQHLMTFIGDKNNRVMLVWFGNTDRVSHLTPLGQYGAARKAIYKVDEYIGKLIKELKSSGKFEDTYIILFSDHGHIGGNGFVNQKWDIANEFFFQKLGFNVRKVLDKWIYPDSDEDDFVFIDDSIGTAHSKVFLPYLSQDSKIWNKPNNFYHLTHYQLANQRGEVNLIEEILSYDVGRGELSSPVSKGEVIPPLQSNISSKPVNFILHKISDDSAIVYKSPDNIAIIQQKKDENNRNVVKYVPIKNFNVSPSGDVNFEYDFHSKEPLNYIDDSVECSGAIYRTKYIRRINPTATTDSHNTVENVARDLSRDLSIPSPLAGEGRVRGSHSEPKSKAERRRSEESRKDTIDKNEYQDIQKFLSEYHTFEEWLNATYKTEYPAAPFLFAKHLFWDESLKKLAPTMDPDFIIVPNKGWSLDNIKWASTTHGYPNYESMHIALFITGPGIMKNAVIEKPHSIVDITPTVLYILDKEYNENQFDGMAIKEIFE